MGSKMDRHRLTFSIQIPVIITAVRCGVWLAILLSFDDNAVFRSHDVENPEVRSLILWTIYSIMFEINQNLQFLCAVVNMSLTNADDPEAVSCALGVFYELAHSHQILCSHPMIPKSLVSTKFV